MYQYLRAACCSALYTVYPFIYNSWCELLLLLLLHALSRALHALVGPVVIYNVPWRPGNYLSLTATLVPTGDVPCPILLPTPLLSCFRRRDVYIHTIRNFMYNIVRVCTLFEITKRERERREQFSDLIQEEEYIYIYIGYRKHQEVKGKKRKLSIFACSVFLYRRNFFSKSKLK